MPVLTPAIPTQLSSERTIGTSLEIRDFRVSFCFAFFNIRAKFGKWSIGAWDWTGGCFSDELQFKASASHSTGSDNLKWQPSKCFLAELHKKRKPEAPFPGPASHLPRCATGWDHTAHTAAFLSLLSVFQQWLWDKVLNWGRLRKLSLNILWNFFFLPIAHLLVLKIYPLHERIIHSLSHYNFILLKFYWTSRAN